MLTLMVFMLPEKRMGLSADLMPLIQDMKKANRDFSITALMLQELTFL